MRSKQKRDQGHSPDKSRELGGDFFKVHAALLAAKRQLRQGEKHVGRDFDQRPVSLRQKLRFGFSPAGAADSAGLPEWRGLPEPELEDFAGPEGLWRASG